MDISHTEKICFVTIGATASFNDLIIAVLDRTFMLALIESGYTKVIVQYGKSGSTLFHDCQRKAGPVDLQIEGFDFKSGDFREAVQMVTASNDREEGMMIAHAGAGSLLDGLHFKIPTVLLPNSSLADNHQEELAQKFADRKLCIRGHLSSLKTAIQDVEIWRRDRDQKKVLGAAQMSKTTASPGIWTVLDQEMGYLDQHLD